MKIKMHILAAAKFLAIMICSQLSGQQQEKITLAVMDFKNNSSTLKYDRLQRAIPEMLKTELSGCSEISVVERKKIEAILSEQALAQAGFIDGEQAQQIGRLAGAEYIITGEINTTNHQLRLDAHLIKVATGQIIGEKVSGKNDKHIEAMIKLLANNFIFELTGSGERKTSDKLKEYKSTWAIFTTGSLVALTTSFHFAYNYNYDKYHQTHQLDKFDFYYDRANQYYKTRNLLMVATSISALTSFILWQSDMSEGNRIFANHNQAPELCSQNNFALIISPHGDGCYVSLRLQL